MNSNTFLGKLFRAIFCWRFKPATIEEVKSSKLIVTQAWSRRTDGTPGVGNFILARAAAEVSRSFDIPVFAQEEVSWALPRHVRQAGIAGGSTTGKSTLAWNTESVAKLQAEYCREHGITKVLMVAHPMHVGRAKWVYEKLGLEVAVLAVPLEWLRYIDPHLQHFRFRYEVLLPLCWFWELGLRVLFVFQGRM